MVRRISAEAAAKELKLELPDSEYAVTARSMDGVNVVLPALNTPTAVFKSENGKEYRMTVKRIGS